MIPMKQKFVVPTEKITERRKTAEHNKHHKNYKKKIVYIKGGDTIEKNATGRPIFDGKNESEVLAKLECAWAYDCPDEEAALYADISLATLKRYLAAHPEVMSRKAQLRNKPMLAARQEIVSGIKGDKNFALTYAERKRPDEFIPQSRSTNTNINLNQNIDDLTEKELDRRIRATTKALIDDKD